MAAVVGVTEEGFVGSYYEAMVVAHLPKNGYVVQYATLVTDDLSAPLKETASDAEVRRFIDGGGGGYRKPIDVQILVEV
ncbi:hypothetical protein ACS0TY_002181 [Phlomoides rotata]